MNKHFFSRIHKQTKLGTVYVRGLQLIKKSFRGLLKSPLIHLENLCNYNKCELHCTMHLYYIFGRLYLNKDDLI